MTAQLPGDTTALAGMHELASLSMWPGELRRVALPATKGKAGGVLTFELRGNRDLTFSVSNDAIVYQPMIAGAIRFPVAGESSQTAPSAPVVTPLPSPLVHAPTFCYVRADTLAEIGDTLRATYTVSSTTNPPRKATWRLRIVVVPPPAIALKHSASIDALTVHPNPGKGPITLSFSVPSATAISLRIFDATGREVVQVDGYSVQAGRHRIVWNGKDANGRAVASGVYLARLQTQTMSRVQKLVVLK
jgi:hypothetical protein